MLRFYSTGGRVQDVELRRAVIEGIAPDGGLYLPQNMPIFSPTQIASWRQLSFLELAIELSMQLFQGIFSKEEIVWLCSRAFTFPLPFISFSDRLSLIELFHGPTLSFKDIGARFLAALLDLWKEECTVLVATSGDTGSAVGHALRDLPHVRVFIFFARGKTTAMQKQQLTTIGGAVTAIEIDGTFEDCQNIVNQALKDKDLPHVTTGNSLNVARLLPQCFTYFYAYNQLARVPIFSVPSGNFGHLVSGLLAKRMGLPLDKFLAATNANDEIPLYLKGGSFIPHAAYPTLAVSMDVGNPSNFCRLLSLYDNSALRMGREIEAVSVQDKQILEAIREMHAQHGYLLDPHGATAYFVLNRYLTCHAQQTGVFLATAHPAKFSEALGSFAPTQLPPPLTSALNKPSHYLTLPYNYNEIKKLLTKS